MFELSSAKKNKVNPKDYNCELDIRNRMLFADFSPLDIEVVEEILYSPLKMSMKKLSRQVGHNEGALLSLIKRLSQTGLLTIDGDIILIDKEMRKYFEFEMVRFNPAFKPDLEFLQGLLHKVPIHVLPIWYAIPRTSNNIFESIVEKYLLTPQIFQRYLSELHFSNPVVSSIIEDLFSAPDFTVSSTDLIAKYNLERPVFEEILLLLEFHFICCLSYRKEGDHLVEIITPFHEWHEYLRFLKNTEPPTLPEESQIERNAATDFAFIEEMSSILQSISKKPKALSDFSGTLRDRAVHKLCLLQLATDSDGIISSTENGAAWLKMSLENRALHCYRHPLNHLHTVSIQIHERGVREAEKTIKRTLHGKWVYFDDFIEGALVPFNETSAIKLRKNGKHWKYQLPSYSDAEKSLIHDTLFIWLFEIGIVATGSHNGKDCFAVTEFGQYFFEE